jgi:hypothetical protein
MNQYETLHTVAKNSLTVLTHLLEKAETHSNEKGVDASTLLNAAIYEDMYNFTKQVQIATDDARRNLCLLAGKEHIKMEDNETTIAQLKERVAKTLEIVNSITTKDFEDADERHISLFWMGGSYVLGKDFVAEFAIPNLMFHTVTAYDILRAQGVNVGKMDFILSLSMHKPAGE